MSKETGGPAFPVPDSEYQIQDTGMMLRDYFAAKAFVAVIGTLNGTVTCEERAGDFVHYANCAYQMADAMIKARGQ